MVKKLNKYCLIAIVTLITVILGIIYKQKYYEIITSVIASIYLILIAYGKRYGFLFGVLYAILYGIVLLVSKLYANAVFSLLFLLPMTITSYIKWGKDNKNYKTLSVKKWALSFVVIVAISVILFFVLKKINGSQPMLDAVVFAVSIITGCLTIFKYTECWLFNALVNIINLVMWIINYLSFKNGLNIIILQVVSIIISIYGIYNWKRSTIKNE